MLVLIHVFLDTHAIIMRNRAGMARSAGAANKAALHPALLPHLNPIERLWGVMHKHVTHNKSYATCAQFADETLSFLREKVLGIGRTSVIRIINVSLE